METELDKKIFEGLEEKRKFGDMISSLVPLMYGLAITSTTIGVVSNSISPILKDEKNKKIRQPNLPST